jgi:hypothetical protein
MDIEENISEETITGYKFKKQYTDDEGNEKYKKVSFWTKAVDVEFNDQTNLEEKLGGIKGISTDFNVENIGYVADMTALVQLRLECLSLIENINNKYFELNTKVDNAISGGNLSAPVTYNFLDYPYQSWVTNPSGHNSGSINVNTSSAFSGSGPFHNDSNGYQPFGVTAGRYWTTPVTIKNGYKLKYNFTQSVSSNYNIGYAPFSLYLTTSSGNTSIDPSGYLYKGDAGSKVVDLSHLNGKTVYLSIVCGIGTRGSNYSFALSQLTIGNQ